MCKRRLPCLDVLDVATNISAFNFLAFKSLKPNIFLETAIPAIGLFAWTASSSVLPEHRATNYLANAHSAVTEMQTFTTTP